MTGSDSDRGFPDVDVESAIDNRPPSNIGRACVTTKEAKRKIVTASER